jgi:hypothetical protein
VRDYSSPLWSLLMFEAFLRQVVDGDPACSASMAPREAVAV